MPAIPHPFYFRKLDVPGFEIIVSELTKVYNLETYGDADSLFTMIDVKKLLDTSPALSTWLRDQDLRLKHAAVVRCSPNKLDYPPHIDSDIPCLSINIPLVNCLGGTTKFYRLTKGNTVGRTQKNNLVYFGFTDDAEFEYCCEYTLERMTLLNTKIPHAVFNPTDQPRLAIALRFINDPWHLFN
jgi:hypothetical protein